MPDQLTAAELIDQLEGMDLTEVDAILEQARDRVLMLERLRAVLSGEAPAKKQRARRQLRLTETVPLEGEETSPSPPPPAKPAIDQTVPLKRRVTAFLDVSGPTPFRTIHSSCGGLPVELKAVLSQPEFAFNESDRTYSLLRRR